MNKKVCEFQAKDEAGHFYQIEVIGDFSARVPYGANVVHNSAIYSFRVASGAEVRKICAGTFETSEGIRLTSSDPLADMFG